MDQHSFPCQLVSWDEAYMLSRKLACKIKSSGFHPDLIIAIGRGGYVPARIVSDFLLHSLLTSIKVEHWDNAACKRPEAAVRFPLAVDIQGQKILIVDDVTDTGETLKVTVDYVRSLHAGEIRTSVMQHKIVSPIVPDFYAEVITEWRWIIYPWAAHEDLVGFTEKVLDNRPATIEQICEKLKERYSLVVDEKEMPEILADLMAMKKAERCGDRYKIRHERPDTSEK
ncbi:MAG: phosphoribosyltransferase [Methanothrix sp.]|nr:phosphoribosyltransferase [Methanothrix sp.]